MEESHGKKLQTLLDQYGDYVKRNAHIASDFINIDHTLEQHDARLYTLEQTN